MPWWGVLIIALGSAVGGAVAAYFGVMIYIAKGLHW